MSHSPLDLVGYQHHHLCCIRSQRSNIKNYQIVPYEIKPNIKLKTVGEETLQKGQQESKPCTNNMLYPNDRTLISKPLPDITCFQRSTKTFLTKIDLRDPPHPPKKSNKNHFKLTGAPVNTFNLYKLEKLGEADVKNLWKVEDIKVRINYQLNSIKLREINVNQLITSSVENNSRETEEKQFENNKDQNLFPFEPNPTHTFFYYKQEKRNELSLKFPNASNSMISKLILEMVKKKQSYVDK
ncbi:hypothetical protein HDU92_001297 [Lobulomyces angularis]|nr:hypothetical protein HDU92_001297 [Lobulomyces angularis]